MLFGVLLVIEIIVCAALVGVILLQKSEGGALGMGGGPSGFMSARGAADLLTRTTAILATAFFVIAAAMLVVGRLDSGGSSITSQGVESIDLDALGEPGTTRPPAAPAQPAPGASAGPSLNDLSAPLPQAGPAAPLPLPEGAVTDPAVRTQPANPAANASPAAPAQ